MEFLKRIVLAILLGTVSWIVATITIFWGCIIFIFSPKRDPLNFNKYPFKYSKGGKIVDIEKFRRKQNENGRSDPVGEL